MPPKAFITPVAFIPPEVTKNPPLVLAEMVAVPLEEPAILIVCPAATFVAPFN